MFLGTKRNEYRFESYRPLVIFVSKNISTLPIYSSKYLLNEYKNALIERIDKHENHVPYQLGDTLSSYTNTISIFAKLERN